ncbi:hypothetical protein TNCV_2445251 [Trichonephila clavipes]|nr:hypothetical protein TNCV_2445251 [Trichonephila clavipes]
MTLLRLEVQGEEMVQLAKSGFGTPIRKKDSPTESVKPTELTIASALASSVKSSVGDRLEKSLIWSVEKNRHVLPRDPLTRYPTEDVKASHPINESIALSTGIKANRLRDGCSSQRVKKKKKQNAVQFSN